MVERTSYKPGQPCWADLGAKDTEAARKFYSTVLGWEFSTPAEEFGGYSMAQLDGDKAIAGCGPVMDPNQPSAWSTYLSVTDLEATLKKVAEHGGTAVTEIMDIGEAGKMAVIQDPAGAFVGAWQALDFAGTQLVNQIGAPCWSELHVTGDAAGVDAFYPAVFGVTTEKLDDDAVDYKMFKVDGEDDPVGGRLVNPGAPASFWLTYFAVADCDQSVANIEAAGGKVVNPPMDTPYGRQAVVVDPQGAAFAVIKLP